MRNHRQHPRREVHYRAAPLRRAILLFRRPRPAHHASLLLVVQASKKGNVDATSLLLSAGASINVKDVFGQTPLHIACQKGARAFNDWHPEA